MAIGKDVLLLQQELGYTFRDVTLLENALTHSSYTNEQRYRGIRARSNERLEFLGDAVLQIVISEYLYESNRNYTEGTLTKVRQFIVCEKTLAKVAAEIHIGEYLNLGHGEENTDCRRRPKILADALEATFAAVYLDCGARGSREYREVILRLLADPIARSSAMQRGDYKTMLQQFIEKDGTALLEYEVTAESGPEHDKTFTVAVKVNNNIVGRGTAHKKVEAEMIAAREALELFSVL